MHRRACSGALHGQVAPPPHTTTSPEKLAAWAHESSLLPAEVPDQATAAELAGYGLPLSVRDAPGAPPVPPFAAPFSGVVPLLARLVRGCARTPCLLAAPLCFPMRVPCKTVLM